MMAIEWRFDICGCGGNLKTTIKQCWPNNDCREAVSRWWFLVVFKEYLSFKTLFNCYPLNPLYVKCNYLFFVFKIVIPAKIWPKFKVLHQTTSNNSIHNEFFLMNLSVVMILNFSDSGFSRFVSLRCFFLLQAFQFWRSLENPNDISIFLIMLEVFNLSSHGLRSCYFWFHHVHLFETINLNIILLKLKFGWSSN